ncbi:MAG: hypothetical protein AB7K71_34110 [Polyangiaceae bacterium]
MPILRLRKGLALLSLAAACSCGRSTDLGESADAGTGATGPGGNGSGATGGSAGGEEALGTRFWEDVEGEPACPTVGVPDKSGRPTDVPPTDEATLYLVMNYLNVGNIDLDSKLDGDAWKGIGFNLDKSCNRASWPEGVLDDAQVDACPGLKEQTCTNSIQNVFDGEFCRDNAMGQVFSMLSLSPDVGEPFRMTGEDWNCALRQGSMSMVFKVSGYNGEPDDSAVRLDLYSSVGLDVPADWNCRDGETNASALKPKWRDRLEPSVTRTYHVAKRDIRIGAADVPGGLPESNWSDTTAYVRSGWLIAELPDSTEFWLNGLNAQTPGLRMLLTKPVIAARIHQAKSGGWEFSEATLGATVTRNAVETSLRELGLCENLCDSFTSTLSYLEQSYDMSSTPNASGAACDTLSFGMQFSAKQYYAFDLVDVPDPPDVSAPGLCGSPRNPDVPPPGCECQPQGGCTPP